MIGYIYQIINNITQERYVGQTINLTKRLSDHRNKLKQNKHSNPKLQAAWNKYGIDNFSFNYDEYEIKNTNDLNQLEIDTIKKYDSYYNGYNLTLGGEGGNTRGKLNFQDYCLIYIGCQWSGMTDKISKYLNIDSSTVSAILRDKAYLWYKEAALNLSENEKIEIIKKFRKIFNVPDNKRTTIYLCLEGEDKLIEENLEEISKLAFGNECKIVEKEPTEKCAKIICGNSKTADRKIQRLKMIVFGDCWFQYNLNSK